MRRRRTLVRAALRKILGDRLGVLPEAVPLRRTVTGRPQLASDHGVDVSCSASGEIALVAVADGVSVGVDVERVPLWDPDVLSEAWLTANERITVMRLSPGDRAEAVTRSWTQKEAVLKGLGTGLGGGPASIETPVGHAAGTVAGWEVRSVAVPAGYLASVAILRRTGIPE